MDSASTVGHTLCVKALLEHRDFLHQFMRLLCPAEGFQDFNMILENMQMSVPKFHLSVVSLNDSSTDEYCLTPKLLWVVLAAKFL